MAQSKSGEAHGLSWLWHRHKYRQNLHLRSLLKFSASANGCFGLVADICFEIIGHLASNRFFGFSTDGADDRLAGIAAKVTGGRRAHARNWNPDYRRHRCDLVLGHR
jgi:hypothetical protein